jgi:hypothetical protein
MNTLTAWMDANLTVQGYALTASQSRALRFGLRWSTGACMALAAAALLLQSEIFILMLVPIGIVAGWTSRHPFDLIWNYGLRHVTGSPPLPPNPPRRRHAFKLATIFLVAIALLFALGHPTAALILGAMMIAVCGLVTGVNFCVPSTVLNIVDAKRSAERQQS